MVSLCKVFCPAAPQGEFPSVEDMNVAEQTLREMRMLIQLMQEEVAKAQEQKKKEKEEEEELKKQAQLKAQQEAQKAAERSAKEKAQKKGEISDSKQKARLVVQECPSWSPALQRVVCSLPRTF